MNVVEWKWKVLFSSFRHIKRSEEVQIANYIFIRNKLS